MMSKILPAMAALSLTLVLALPGPAGAAEKRTDGLRHSDGAMTEFSSQGRRWHRRHVVRRHMWGPRWAGPGWRYGYYPRYRYYRPYAWSPYYNPYVGPRVSFGLGFGPRYW